jgi:hypothetical protein
MSPPHLIVSPGDLAPPGAPLADVARALLESQQRRWPALRDGYKGLNEVKVRPVMTDGGMFRVQWNPARMISSSASVDQESIRNRPCFLCQANLPSEQQGVPAGDGFLILCNPYPIFPEHFTIVHTEHIPQRIAGRIGGLLGLARQLAPRYTLFYNGPRCGASAPDHLHFQAGDRGFLPIESELPERWNTGVVVGQSGPTELRSIDDGVRRYYALESSDCDHAAATLEEMLTVLALREPTGEEPMVNLLAWYAAGSIRVVVFRRKVHRPARYYAKGEDRVLISPAAVDCGGVMITPVERDFARMDDLMIREIFSEVLA